MEVTKVEEKPILFMMVGLPGSGKSSIAKSIQVRDENGVCSPTIYASDELRKELYGDVNDQSHNSDLFIELQRRVKVDLSAGKDVIYDATNLSKKRRIAFLSELNNISCHKVCVLAMAPVSWCVNSQRGRSRKVSKDVILRMRNHFCPPDYSEGFDSIAIHYNYSWLDKKKYTVDWLFDGIGGLNRLNQENKHHRLTVGKHCHAAADYIEEQRKESTDLVMAALLHDIGKKYTKTDVNAKGVKDGDCHYYMHSNCGAYEAILYLNNEGFDGKFAIHVSNLIYYHMHPYVSWKASKRALNRDKAIVGEEFFNEVMLLNEADRAAH